MLLAACAVLVAAAPAEARVPKQFFGMKNWAFHPSLKQFQRMAQGGIGTYRQDFLWSGVEAFKGLRNWTEYDSIVGDASRAGVAILPTLTSSPPWAAKSVNYPPKTRATKRAWLAFVRDAVRRYGRHGKFWTEHPEVPYRPITAWQVWNEPSFPAYWFKHPNARQYAAFLYAAGRAIHKLDRRATVVMAGLPESKHGIPIATYLTRLYRYPHIRSAFDVVAIHPYARGPAGVQGALIRVRAIMNRNHDTRVPIWLTEIGWASKGPRNPFVTTRRGQAARLRDTYKLLLRVRHRYRVGMAVWFSLRDRALWPGERDWWAPHTGLFDVRGRPKPAWRSLVKVTGGRVGRGALAN